MVLFLNKHATLIFVSFPVEIKVNRQSFNEITYNRPINKTHSTRCNFKMCCTIANDNWIINKKTTQNRLNKPFKWQRKVPVWAFTFNPGRYSGRGLSSWAVPKDLEVSFPVHQVFWTSEGFQPAGSWGNLLYLEIIRSTSGLGKSLFRAGPRFFFYHSKVSGTRGYTPLTAHLGPSFEICTNFKFTYNHIQDMPTQWVMCTDLLTSNPADPLSSYTNSFL